MKQQYQCTHCGAEINRYPSQVKGKTGVYCSRAHANAAKELSEAAREKAARSREMCSDWLTLAEAGRLLRDFALVRARVADGTLQQIPVAAVPPQYRAARANASAFSCQYYLLRSEVEALGAVRFSPTTAGEWLTIPAAAALLSVHFETIQRAVDAGNLPGYPWQQIPADERAPSSARHRVYIARSDLEQFDAARYHRQMTALPTHHRPTDLAYAAGFVDGEGCLSLSPHQGQGKTHYSLRVAVVNTEITPIHWLRKLFDGTITHKKADGTRHKECHCWSITAGSAYRFLRLIRPYMLVKGRQADLLIGYQERLASYTLHTNRRISPAEQEWRDAQATALRALNARGPAFSSSE